MSCPLFSPQDSTCRLVEAVAADDDESELVDLDAAIDLEICLSADKRYRQCPRYRSQLSDLSP